MKGTFKDAAVFNADITNWNTAKTTPAKMTDMFSGATAFECNTHLPSGMTGIAGAQCNN